MHYISLYLQLGILIFCIAWLYEDLRNHRKIPYKDLKKMFTIYAKRWSKNYGFVLTTIGFIIVVLVLIIKWPVYLYRIVMNEYLLYKGKKHE